ncbi:MAG: T9SS type A sorting domain-containing protein [Melioribacteraceae bacterium]|nr:T9SS type A sorting domain-containing protein [Melioribacteraceae bacterium]MCF8353433.1 T9SS type A sorting domain-containing protein [Melioribacteraceae bacterium]MCF8418994.1 T9SS type A sorting domain-containing protein [Melioribacteraceae bacterium]
MRPYLLIIFILIIFSNLNAQWEQIGTPQGLPSYQIKVSAIGTINNKVILSTIDNDIYISDDNGDTWRRPVGTYPKGPDFNGTAVLNNKLFAGSSWTGIGVFVSNDDGENWDTLSNGLADESLGITGNNLLGTYDGKLFLSAHKLFVSDDEGENWIESTNGLPVGGSIYDVTYDGTYFYCSYKKVYKSIDGFDWSITENTNLPFISISNLMASGDNLIAVAQNTGIYQSTDEGDTWAAVSGFQGNDSASVHTLIKHDGKLYAATGGHVYFSDDDGSNWFVLQDSGIRPNNMTVLSANDSYLYAGQYASGTGQLWRINLVTTSVEKNNVIPDGYVLHQNYPNPFNPSTTIQISIPRSSFVSLKVYDILGNEIATLINQELSPGSYKIKFDKSTLNMELSSGVYFYRLRTNGFNQTRKFILTK